METIHATCHGWHGPRGPSHNGTGGGGALAGNTTAAAQGGPAAVATDVVVETEMSETIAVFGEVVSGRQSRVAARVAGVAAEVPVRVGDKVAAGDVLRELDPQLFEIGLAEAQAAVDVAEAGIATVEARLDRAQGLPPRRKPARERGDRRGTARGPYQRPGRGQRRGRRSPGANEVARTALRRARYDLENATVRAPFDAVVLSVATELGQFINPGSEVTMLLEKMSAMEIEANVPARFIDALRPDQPVEARTDAGGALTLALRAVLPTEFSSTRTRPVRFEVLEAGQKRSRCLGQLVTLDVPVSAPRTIAAVPKDALIQSPSGWSVFVAADGKAVPRPVEIGQALGTRFEVLSGLAPVKRWWCGATSGCGPGRTSHRHRWPALATLATDATQQGYSSHGEDAACPPAPPDPRSPQAGQAE